MAISTLTSLVEALRRTDLGVTVTLVLLALLTGRELLAAHGGQRARLVAHLTTLASAPVLLLFSAVIAVRFLHLLNVL